MGMVRSEKQEPELMEREGDAYEKEHKDEDDNASGAYFDGNCLRWM
jgi:hypothetical protein